MATIFVCLHDGTPLCQIDGKTVRLRLGQPCFEFGLPASAAGEAGPKILATDVVMPDLPARERLARTVLRFAESLG